MKAKILLLTLLNLTSITFAQTPQVIAISPSFNEIAESNQPKISVKFNVPINSSTFNGVSFAVMGERTGYHNGVIEYNNENKTVTFSSRTNFNAGERVTTILSNKIRSSQGDTLQGFIWTFRIPSSPAPVNFSKPIIYNGGGYYMQCVDMNNDGYPDIVTSNGVILINNGVGVFNNSWTIDDINAYEPIECEDFNRDGYMDILYSGASGLKVGLGDGKGNFSYKTYRNWFYNFISADFNGDGYPDIAGVSSTTYIAPDTTILNYSIVFNDGNGNFNDTIMYHISGGGNPTFIIATDLDNDGNEDIVIASVPVVPPLGGAGTNGFIVLKNNGKGIFSDFQLYPNSIYSINISFPYYLYSSDFNNDSYNDIALISSGSGVVDLNIGNGTLGNDTADLRDFWPAENPAPISGSDINGDGWIDIVVSGYMWPPELQIPHYAISINENSYFPGNSPWEDFNDTLTSLIYGTVAADLNNDGKIDLVHCGMGVFVTINQDTVTSIKINKNTVKEFYLHQNYPNPFNPSTTIQYSIPSARSPLQGGARGGLVTLKVYDILGREIATLINEEQKAGNYKVEFNGANLSSGVYFYQLRTGNFTATKKLLLLK